MATPEIPRGNNNTLKVTGTENSEFQYEGKTYYKKSISIKNIPLPFPIIGTEPIPAEKLGKIGRIAQELVAIIQTQNNSTDLLGKLKALLEIGNLEAVGKGDSAKIRSGASFDGTGGKVHITNNELLTLFGYTTITDQNGNYTNAQKMKEKLNPELKDVRYVGIFTEWIQKIAASK